MPWGILTAVAESVLGCDPCLCKTTTCCLGGGAPSCSRLTIQGLLLPCPAPSHTSLCWGQVSLGVYPAPPTSGRLISFLVSLRAHCQLVRDSTSVTTVRLEVIEAGGKEKVRIHSKQRSRKNKKTNTY